MEMALRFLFSSHRLMMLYICTQIHENIPDSFKVIELTQIHTKNSKGHKSENVGGIIVFALFTSSVGGLYLYHVA